MPDVMTAALLLGVGIRLDRTDRFSSLDIGKYRLWKYRLWKYEDRSVIWNSANRGIRCMIIRFGCQFRSNRPID
jgi:hypothetical protein